MLDGPVGPTPALLALPVVAQVTAQTLATIADAWFVGRLGIVPLAGIPQHPAVYQRLNEEVLPAFSRGLL